MAEIRACLRWIVITSGDQFAVVHECDTSSWQTFQVPQSVEGLSASKTNGDKKTQQKEESSNRILASAFSRNGQYFAVCDDQKQLHIYSTSSGWSLYASRPLVRRSTTVLFLGDCQTVLVGDKSGDIYRFSLSGDGLNSGQLLLGHLSMLLDMTVTKNDRKIVTADRDERVRISNYPNACNISQYCMGHRQFVKCLEYAEDIDVIFSGSGDGTIRGWRGEGGARPLVCLQCAPEGAQAQQGGDATPRLAVQQLAYLPDQRLLVAAIYGLDRVEVYRVEAGAGKVGLEAHQSLALAECEVWSLAVLPDGHLLTLAALQDRPLTVHKLQARQFLELSEEDTVMTNLREFVNGQQDFFKASLSIPSEIPSLWKVTVDNFSKYQEEKNKRLQKRLQTASQPSTDGKKRKT